MFDDPWLLVDDDATFAEVLARALGREEITCFTACNVDAALVIAERQPIGYCVLDLNLAGENGLDLMARLLEVRPHLKVCVMTGYGSIATAVEAMRRGAADYLCKPVSTEQLINALRGTRTLPPLRSGPPSVEELEREHIQRVLEDNDGNISATSRALNMHRRTLQRKLKKFSRWRW